MMRDEESSTVMKDLNHDFKRFQDCEWWHGDKTHSILKRCWVNIYYQAH